LAMREKKEKENKVSHKKIKKEE